MHEDLKVELPPLPKYITDEPINPLKKPDVIENFDEIQLKEFIKCAKDPVYFANRYVKIRHAVKGSIQIELRPYQEKMLRNYAEHRWCVSMCGRQMGKTQVAAIYLLWKSIFKREQTILITAHIASQSTEVLGLIKYSYERIPDFLRPGVELYNQGSVKFDNGSRIICRATSENSTRGLSVSVMYCCGSKTTVEVRNKETGEEKLVTISDLYNELLKESETTHLHLTL